MSRHLPARPNLEHLKKQAKDLLSELQRRNPGLQLADAQHALAREYGFPSWPKLKAHVELLEGAPPDDAPAAPAPAKENPFVGTWTTDVAKSQRHPSNQFQSATIQFAVAGDTVTIADVVVSESGQEEHGKNTVHADGRERVFDHGYTVTARWNGVHVLETVAKKDGQVVGWGKYEVSPDGNTLTISGDQQLIVLDRQ